MSGSLSEKIAGILSSAPASFDPEDDVHEETSARVVFEGAPDDVASDDDANLSSFRKQTAELLEDVDKRYEGKRSSRKRLRDSDSEEWGPYEEESALEGSELDSEQNNDDESNRQSDDDDDDEDEYEDEDNNFEKGSSDEAHDAADAEEGHFKHLEDSNLSSQTKKGMCVRHQLSVWESLLEIRIQTQKCLLNANKMPQIAVFNDIKEKCGTDFTNPVAETKSCIGNLLDKLLCLQTLLLKRYPETKNLMSGSAITSESNAESDEEIPSDCEDEQYAEPSEEKDEEVSKKKRKISDYDAEITKRHQLYAEYRNSVIQKWNEKTRVAVSKSGGSTHSTVQQIEHILSDKEKLIKRTQLKRTEYAIVGSATAADQTNGEAYNTNIFDDTDFYHHLLRELIEFKSSDVTDPVQLGRQWIQLQNLRSKMKRKVDTRATKGRKIRYAVHSKLVNFMAPVDDSTWQNEAKNELYSSLFGNNRFALATS